MPKLKKLVLVSKYSQEGSLKDIKKLYARDYEHAVERIKKDFTDTDTLIKREGMKYIAREQNGGSRVYEIVERF